MAWGGFGANPFGSGATLPANESYGDFDFSGRAVYGRELSSGGGAVFGGGYFGNGNAGGAVSGPVFGGGGLGGHGGYSAGGGLGWGGGVSSCGGYPGGGGGYFGGGGLGWNGGASQGGGLGWGGGVSASGGLGGGLGEDGRISGLGGLGGFGGVTASGGGGGGFSGHEMSGWNSFGEGGLRGGTGGSRAAGGNSRMAGGGPNQNLTDLDIARFVSEFTARRYQLGLSQEAVANSISAHFGGRQSISHDTIRLFENMELGPTTMARHREIFQAWLNLPVPANNSPETPTIKRRKKRTYISPSQRSCLDAYFAKQPNPSPHDLAKIARELIPPLPLKTVRKWFVNRRFTSTSPSVIEETASEGND